MRLSLRTRFAAVCILLVAISMLAASVVWITGLSATSRSATEISIEAIRTAAVEGLSSRARSTIQMMVSRLINAVYFYDVYEMQEIIGPLVAQPNVRYVYVFDDQGALIHDGQAATPRLGEEMDDPLAPAVVGIEDVTLNWTEDLLDVSAPLVVDGERLGGVRVGFSLDELKQEVADAGAAIAAANRQEVRRRIRALLGILVPLFLLGVGLAMLIAQSMLRPIKGLVRFTNRIERGNYNVSVPTRRSDEIGELMRAFQRMGDSVRRNTMQIRHLAYHDTLSGLPNRLMFREALEQQLGELDQEAGERVGLLFLDLDDFKRVNDTLGHDHGDELLVAFANRLKVCVDELEQNDRDKRLSRTMVGRLGGDEFTVMLAGHEVADIAERLGQLIIDKLRDPFSVHEREFFVTTSIGITVYPDDASTPDLLVKNADIAMYGAKISGKNRCQRFHRGLMTDSGRRLDLEAQLRRAVESGEFNVLYQPIVDVRSGRVVGAEALVRATREALMDVPPAIFIPVAEEIGLIEEIGRQILQTACRQAAGWPAAGEDVPYVSVNLSARQIHSRDIVGLVDSILEESGLPANRLTLEITESSVLGTEASTSTILSAFRQRGVRIWLDDFGTGFSGLSHLRRMPVDGVKIDRTFISDILVDPDDLALTGAIISMAHSLNMDVIAEGVEITGQLKILSERNCNLAQGYLFGKPMESAELEKVLKRSAVEIPG